MNRCMSIKLKCSAIVVPTNSGVIAKKISRFRPSCPILALTYDEDIAKNLLLNFGVYPLLVGKSNSIDNVIKDQSKKLGADDFAEFLLEVPGAYAQIGSRNEEIPYCCVAHHNELFDIDEKALLIATNLEVDYVLKKLKTI